MKLVLQLGIGIFFSGLIAWVAYRRKSLTKSGVVGAMVVGTMIFGFGGWVWGALLITFFLLSTLLSHYKEAVKKHLAEKFEKGHRRDLGQTLANGGAGALAALAFYFFPDPVIFASFVGAMATVNADTWATELGVLAKRPPRLITSWRTVEPGTSGGISMPGTIASMAGALAIGLAAVLFLFIDRTTGGFLFLLPALLGGVAGCMFDSLMGATVQAIYYSPSRQKETEKKIDRDGTINIHQRGWRWLTNDWVNFLSSLIGMLVGAGVYKLGVF